MTCEKIEDHIEFTYLFITKQNIINVDEKFEYLFFKIWNLKVYDSIKQNFKHNQI